MRTMSWALALSLTGCASMGLGVPDVSPVATAVSQNPNGSVVCATWAGGKMVVVSQDKGTAPRNGSVIVGDGCNVTFTNGAAK